MGAQTALSSHKEEAKETERKKREKKKGGRCREQSIELVSESAKLFHARVACLLCSTVLSLSAVSPKSEHPQGIDPFFTHHWMPSKTRFYSVYR